MKGDRVKEGEYLEWSTPFVLRNHPRLHFLEVEGRLCDDCPFAFLNLFYESQLSSLAEVAHCERSENRGSGLVRPSTCIEGRGEWRAK